MIVHDIVGTEENPCYRIFEAQNLVRQYDFTHSLFIAASSLNHPGLSHEQLKAMNFHGIACLHAHAGAYRPHNVEITNTPHRPPPHEQVQGFMEDFVQRITAIWADADPLTLAATVLWRLNWIHPFVNGNGRTACVAAYYTLCRKFGFWLPGTVLVPELIRANRPPYYEALRAADQALDAGHPDVSQLASYLQGLLIQQLESAPPANG